MSRIIVVEPGSPEAEAFDACWAEHNPRPAPRGREEIERMKTAIHRTCFAATDLGGCAVIEEPDCLACPFFKTRAQLHEERRLGRARLQALGILEETQARYKTLGGIA